MSSDYTLTYSPTLDTAGKYHVECSNIGYNMSPSTVTDFVFTVTAPPTGSITASPNPCIIAINASTCSTQLT